MPVRTRPFCRGSAAAATSDDGTAHYNSSYSTVIRRFLLVTALSASLPLLALPRDARGEVTYDTKFTGVDDTIQSDLESASQLVALVDKNPESLSALKRRAETDLARLQQVMQADGYYDSALKSDVEPTKDKDDYLVTITIDPGAVYTLAEVVVRQEDGSPPPLPELVEPEKIGLALGKTAFSAPIVAAEPRIAHAYALKGWPYAKVVRHEVEIDIATKTMHVVYIFAPGPRANFGATAIDGLTRLDPLYVQRRVKWVTGSQYDQGPVDDTRQSLITTGLFGSVVVAPQGKVAGDGSVPMDINLTERPLRTFSVGGSYDTSLGIEANTSWEHRDLFGYAEDLKITATGGQSDSSLNAKFTRPDMVWVDQDFIVSATFSNELEDAFRAIDQQLQIGFQQHFTPTITGGYSLLGEHARVDEKVDYRVYTLVGIPLFLRDNESNDLLNPTEGWRAGIEFTPYLRAIGSDLTYVQTKITASTYQKLDDKGKYVLAVQGIVGASCCASLDSIPKDHRFYAGGGGSVRGFGYQKAGPWDIYYNPIGGRSMLVGSAELRTMVTDTIQLVPFFDAGSDDSTPLPKPLGKLYLGAGIGVRYFTPIGPVRLDVATPLNPHDKGDSPVQLYVSLGQAF